MTRLPSGAWIDTETGEVIAADLPRRLQCAVDAALGACCSLGSSHAEAINRSLHKRAERMLAALQAEHDVLVARLDHGWGWLDRHQDDPTFGEREDYVLAWLGQYESTCKAIAGAQRALA